MAENAGRRGKSGRQSGRLGRSGLALGTVLLLAAGASAAAEPHRVEVVGVHPIRDAVRGKTNPRDEAIQKALWEGVSRVALELIGEASDPEALESDEAMPAAGTGPAKTEASADPTARFRKILGPQILPYTRSFRIVEDRGERPVLFADEPGVRSEYLVVVEVLVDVDRVTAELARAGLVERPELGSATRQVVTIELIGLERHAGLRRVLEALRQSIGATRIETLEFSPARQLLSVEAPFGPDEIAARLGRVESADLILDPVEVDREGRRIRVLAQWFPPAPAEEEALDGAGLPASAAPRR
jgi:hypothetical protein